MAERLAAAGAVAVLVGWLLGVVVERWSLDIEGLAYLVAAALVLVVLFAGILPRVYTLRTAATVIGAFALMDLALLITDFDEWETLTIVLTIVYLIGAAALLYGAWGATDGSLMADLRSMGGVMAGSLPDRLVLAGATLALLGWFLVLLVAQVFNFVTQAEVAVLAVALVLAVRWSGRDPSAAIRWPVPVSYVVAGLAVVAGVFGLLWFLRIIERTLDIGGLDVLLPVVVYLVGLGVLVAGALLAIRPGPAAVTS
jgi:peptidoglycan/LPS O-acetylase OafA/YrhL